MAFQGHAFQTNAFQVCVNHKEYAEPKRRYEVREEIEKEQILAELKRRDDLAIEIQKLGISKLEEDDLMEMLAALLLANEYCRGRK